MTKKSEYFMQEAIKMAIKGMQANEGGPFGAVVVKDDQIIGRGHNMVASTNDPTAHAEVVAIRDACKNIGDFQLKDCIIYSSCEPCPMCLGAIYWARPDKIVYACTRQDAATVGFDDDFIYKEIPLAPEERQITAEQLLREEGLIAFRLWQQKQDKIEY